MKNVKVLLCCLFIFSFQFIYAQGFGVKGGVLYSNLKFKNSTPNTFFVNKPEQLAGFTFGAMYQKQFNKILFIKAELGYSRKGAKFINPYDKNSPTFKIKLDYIDFSVIGICSIYEGISIEIGTETSFLVKNDEFLFYSSSDFKSNFDISLVGGITYLFNDKIEFSARYCHGMRHVFQFVFTDSVGEEDGSFNFFNRNLEVSVGYYFRKNRDSKI